MVPAGQWRPVNRGLPNQSHVTKKKKTKTKTKKKKKEKKKKKIKKKKKKKKLGITKYLSILKTFRFNRRFVL